MELANFRPQVTNHSVLFTLIIATKKYDKIPSHGTKKKHSTSTVEQSTMNEPVNNNTCNGEKQR